MIHDLEIILYLVKSEIKRIDAVGIPVLTKQEDIANARLSFENGCVANLTASRISPEAMRKIRIFQPDCYMSLDYQSQKGKIFRKIDNKISQQKVKIEKEEPLKLELSSFVKCVLKGNNPKVSGHAASQALIIANKIIKKIF